MFGFTKLASFAAALSVLAATSTYAAPLNEEASTHILEPRLTHYGRATWFHVGGNAGHCGGWSTDDEMIVAIPTTLYERNGGSNCGQRVSITNTENGKHIEAVVRDSCPPCDEGSLDLSPAAFNALASGGLDQGLLNNIQWNFRKRD
ncbi:hypothetical protein QFC20_005278 [Naganishia adeliensis]|uniref:Uncharacterized protein n=1 Tax=Naganishia adeliensis TaxID=92952 RepID=A0ACC2VPQ0_9TREE|nr:hypothetical protein QFC20_005278 [Naganishia adeliensis]